MAPALQCQRVLLSYTGLCDTLDAWYPAACVHITMKFRLGKSISPIKFIDEDGYTTLATILGVDGRQDTVAPIAERLHPQCLALSLANIAKILYAMLMSVHVDLAQHGWRSI